jgi:hypothetical protein
MINWEWNEPMRMSADCSSASRSRLSASAKRAVSASE